MSFKYIRYFMDVAKLTANLSYAERLKVGAIVVKDNRIVSIGYNGTPSGWSNVCEHEVDGRVATKDEVIHAEENAILKLARDGESGKGSTMYITHAPCITCARLIYNAGVSSIYYESDYRDTNGIQFLQKCGISVQKLGNGKPKSSENEGKPLTKSSFWELYQSQTLKLMDKKSLSPVKVTTYNCPYNMTDDLYSSSIKIKIQYGCPSTEIESPVFPYIESANDWCKNVLYDLYLQNVISAKLMSEE